MGFITGVIIAATATPFVPVSGEVPADSVWMLPFGLSVWVCGYGLITGSVTGAITYGFKRYSAGLIASLVISLALCAYIYLPCASCLSTLDSSDAFLLIYPAIALLTGIFVSFISLKILTIPRIGSALGI